MHMPNTSLLQELRDIADIGAVSWWPLAPGWWVAIIVSTLLLCYLIYKLYELISFRNSWRYTIYKELSSLLEEESSLSAQDKIETISKYLRITNIKKFGRQDCASLTGDKWMSWLEMHDPQCYKWTKHEKILATSYSNKSIDSDNIDQQILEMVDALRKWLKK